MHRNEAIASVRDRREPFDVVIIGGGATGAGVAVDAASRGYSTLLLEQSDFGKGTSTRSTKLIHGGVRYLQQGNIALVMEALEERGLLRQNAPHLVSDMRFIVPTYDWWEGPFYGAGLKLYDLLAGRHGFGRSALLDRAETLAHIPTLRTEGLRGGVLYHDGQFDDARLLLALLTTASQQGAIVLNYTPVVDFLKDTAGIVDGVTGRDDETGELLTIMARVVIAAAGAFTDALLRLDDAATQPILAPSQGVHLVLDRRFLPGNTAIMVPHTPDGRVMFAIPWHDRTLVGTTDTPIAQVDLEPRPLPQEIDFLIGVAGDYLAERPRRSDVLSTFAGIRPLVGTTNATNTAALSRDHTVHITRSGLVAICGGKWTTYRHMAEDAVNQAATLGVLPGRSCRTRTLKLHGAAGEVEAAVAQLEKHESALAERLHGRLPYRLSEVAWSIREQMARTVDDVLSRRTRALLLDARAAVEAAPCVAALLRRELGCDAAWESQQLREFEAIAAGYIVDANGGEALC